MPDFIGFTPIFHLKTFILAKSKQFTYIAIVSRETLAACLKENQMKKNYLLFTVVLFLNLSYAFCQKASDIVGKWHGVDYWNNPSDLVFTENGFTSFTINGETLGGENFNIKGEKADLKYELDFSKNPYWIDLVVYSKSETKEKGRIKGIIKFVDIDTVIIAMSFDDKRIENFDSENQESTILMKRTK